MWRDSRAFGRAVAVCLAVVAVSCSSDSETSPAQETANDRGGAAAPPGGGPPGEGGPPPAWIIDSMAEPRGVVVSRPEVSPGYVLFEPLLGATTYLLDVQGRVVHTWTHPTAGGSHYLLQDGSLLRGTRLPEPPGFRAGGVGGGLLRKTWEGELTWQWQLANERRILHHDIEPLPNGNILAIAWELKTPEEARRAGRRADSTPEQGLWSEWLLEIEPLPPDDARIVWEWHLWDHLVQSHDPEADNYGDPSREPGRLDVNGDRDAPIVDEEELARLKALGYVPDDATPEDLQSDFLHMNSVDYDATLDQIAVSNPEIGELWILDHSTTTEQARGSTGGRSGRGGEILYRWGNPKLCGRGEKEDQQLFYQHQVEWVPEGWPGAGNLTVFNNGGDGPPGEWSSVLEIAPPLAADGSYALEPSAPFGPAAPAWSYTAAVKETFYAPFISGAHRLLGGNTFICSGPQGRLMEVTPEGQVVWELRSPFRGKAPGWVPPMAEQFKYGIYRARKLSPDHPGLAGRPLWPLEPQPPVDPDGAGS